MTFESDLKRWVISGLYCVVRDRIALFAQNRQEGRYKYQTNDTHQYIHFVDWPLVCNT